MTRALAPLLAAGVAVGLVSCDVESGPHPAEQQALLVAELEARLAEGLAEDARVGLDKMEVCLKRFAHGRRARNAERLVRLLDDERDALLEVLQAEELRVLGLDLVDHEGRAVERLELEVAYQQGRLDYSWDPSALEVLRRFTVQPDLEAQLWCDSLRPPRGWEPRTPPPMAEGARHLELGEVLERGRLRVRMGLTTSGRMVPEG